ncbi:MAG: hypothetical protein KGJ60_14380 [Verrucomicrobiota bacterium]|nr:hypothetical protein [Verrucomicrobiota bacterium]
MLPRRRLVAVLIDNMQKEIKEVKSALESLPEKMERLIFKSGDDVAVSISRSFERLEERIDAGESRIYSRLTDIEDGIGEELKAVRLAVAGQEAGATD